MIVEGLASLIGSVLVLVIGALPVGTLTLPSFGPMVGLARALDPILPVHEAFSVVAWVVGWGLIVFAYQLVVYIYRLIPLKGT